MSRLISAQGVTANETIGSPAPGMKWIVKWALVLLHTGTGSGSRSATLVVVRASNAYNRGAILAGSGVQTGTSTTYAGTGEVTSNQEGSDSTVYYDYPEIFSIDSIELIVSLISGDTVDYYILVEEASS
jgi:hypothetical protein